MGMQPFDLRRPRGLTRPLRSLSAGLWFPLGALSLWLCACTSTPRTPTFRQANAAPLAPAPGGSAGEGPAAAASAAALAADGEADAGSGEKQKPETGESQPATKPISAAASPPTVPEEVNPAQTVLARIGDAELTLGELMQSLYYREGEALRAQFNLAVGAELAGLEAARLGLSVDPALLERRSSEVLGEFARKNVPEGESLDRFLSDRLGFEPLRFKNRLRQDSLRELITERVVRAHSLSNEHCDVRVLVADEAAIAQALQRLAAGEDFLQLVAELSRDPSAKEGGRVPFLLRDERAPLSRLAFKTEVGQVGGPLRLPGAAGNAPSLLLRVEARPEPLQGNWTGIGAAVEASLVETAVTEEEYVAWQVAMESRYQLDLEPFYALLGQNVRQP